MILAYKPDGASDFLGRVMKEVTQGNWTGDIPATATAGNRVAYYIEAQGKDEQTIGTKGTADDPLVITLKGSGAPTPPPGREEPPDETEGPSWFIGVGIGGGVGYTSGTPEVNALVPGPKGFAAASTIHVLPEIGYFLRDKLLLSVQLRLQVITTTTDLVLPPGTPDCGSDHICSPAKQAIAGFAKLSYLFGDGSLHPYVSGAVGGGQIRHSVSVIPNGGMCGSSTKDACSDTTLAGPVFVGAGGGIIFNATDTFALTLGIATQLGFPNFTFNIDFNGGVAVEF
jgi:hypothetical protein